MSPELQLPHVTPHFTQPENSLSIDFYQRLDVDDYVEQFVHCYNVVLHQMAFQFGQSFTMKTNLLAFIECPSCNFAILTNRDARQKITCKVCSTPFHVIPLEKEDLRSVITRIEARLGKSVYALAGCDVVLVLQPASGRIPSDVFELVRSAGFAETDSQSTPARLLAQEMTRRGLFDAVPYVAFRKSYDGAEKTYAEDTPPDVDRVLREIRSRHDNVRSASRVLPANVSPLERAFSEGRFDEAVPLLQRALLANPGNPLLLTQLIHALLRLGRHADARKHAVQALLVHPENADLQASMALVHAAAGEKRQAISCLERALAIEPAAYQYETLLQSLRR